MHLGEQLQVQILRSETETSSQNSPTSGESVSLLRKFHRSIAPSMPLSSWYMPSPWAYPGNKPRSKLSLVPLSSLTLPDPRVADL